MLNKKNSKYFFVVFLLFSGVSVKAQFESFKDSVVQLYGVVLTADSLRALPGVSIIIKGQNRGTMSTEQGVFSIVALKGDKIEFSSVGFKNKTITVPSNIQGNQYSVIQLMVTDTIYLPATIIRARPTKEQFERDFLKTQVPDDNYEIARKSTNEATRRYLMATLPTDAREASKNYINKQTTRYYYNGQVPPMNILNPFAWNEFIQAWKRGDFKNQSTTAPPPNYGQ